VSMPVRRYAILVIGATPVAGTPFIRGMGCSLSHLGGLPVHG
jgi:hypothetical protein